MASWRAPRRLVSERGFALALALVTLLVMAALAAWSLFIGVYGFRGGRNAVRLAQAFAAAEEGAQLHLAQGDWRMYSRLRPGEQIAFSGAAVGGPGRYRGRVTRLGESLFLVETDGFDSGRRARQRVGILVRTGPAELDVRAALETRGDVEIMDMARIVGQDEAPGGWTCPGLRPSRAALRVPAADSGRVDTSRCTDGACLRGDPAIQIVEAGPVAPIDDVGIGELARRATTTLSGGDLQIGPDLTGRGCDADNPVNWGDPIASSGPCGRYLPVVYSSGDLGIHGGQGQVFLIVDGDLVIDGDTDLHGVILVRGRLVAGGDARVRGAVMVANESGTMTVLQGRALVGYSSCAVDRALAAAGLPAVLDERSWVQFD